MHPPWNHPAVWSADELYGRDDWLWEFSAAELDELEHLRPALAERDEPLEQMLSSSAQPARLRAKMSAIRDALEHGSGAIRLRGFPVGEMDVSDAEVIFGRLMRMIGTLVPQTAAGQLVFRVQDEGFAAGHPQARGPSSSRSLSFHTDRCDVIGFLCIRAARVGGENQLVSSMALYNQLFSKRPDLLQVLCQPFWYQRHNVDPANPQAFYQQPVFSVCQGHFAANLLRVLIERAYADAQIGPMPAHQREALDVLESLADQPSLYAAFRQQPGDIVLLNNFVVLHRRSAFEDHDLPERKRLLLRAWLSVPNSRPLDASLTASYGVTDAGAVRGGMRSYGEPR